MAVATIYDVIVTHWFRKRTEKISDYEVRRYSISFFFIKNYHEKRYALKCARLDLRLFGLEYQ